MRNLRAYIVHEVDEPDGFPVVAHTAKEAKKIGYHSGQLYSEWPDIRVNWLKGANVTGLPMGLMDSTEALKRGIFEYVVSTTCEICGKDRTCRNINGKIICSDCEDTTDTEQQQIQEFAEKLGAQVGDKVLIINDGSGVIRAGFDFNVPHIITEIHHLIEDVVFDNGAACLHRPTLKKLQEA